MEKMTMFGEIGQFADKSYFDAHRYGGLYFNNQDHGLEFFAFVHTDAYNNAVFHANIKGAEEQQKYLDMMLDMAVHKREDISVTTNDRIVLLSTCSETSTNGRDILLGRITDEVYEDTLKVKPTVPNYLPITSIDELPGLFEQSSWSMKALMLAIPLLFTILLIVTIRALRQRKRIRALRRGEDRICTR
jgi:sortase B